jgi:hypothetical protein
MELEKTVLLGFSVFLAAGCTSVGDIRNRQAVYSGQSNKAPDFLAGCIADSLESRKMPNVQARPTAKGFAVMRVDQTMYGPDYAFVVDIERGTPTNIVAHSALPFAAGNQMIVDSIVKCSK